LQEIIGMFKAQEAARKDEANRLLDAAWEADKNKAKVAKV
jgi:hypothetical protein